MRKWEEFLVKVADYKQLYSPDHIKLPAKPMYTMIMAGAFDHLLDTPPSIETRWLMVEQMQAALGSEATIAKGKTVEALDIGDIKSELTRKSWLSQRNPFFSFVICDEYHDALISIGMVPTGSPNLRYRQQHADIFSNFAALKLPRVVKFYKYTEKRIGVVAQYLDCSSFVYGTNKKAIKMKLFDGSETIEGVVWPQRNTLKSYNAKIATFFQHHKKKTGIFYGRIGISDKGYFSFSVDDVVQLS